MWRKSETEAKARASVARARRHNRKRLNMGKYGIFRDPKESKIAKLLFEDKKTAAEVSQIMGEEGAHYTPEQVRGIKKTGFELMRSGETREEIDSDFLLESIQKLVQEWEDVYGSFKTLFLKYQAENKDFEQIQILREMKSMLNTAIRSFQKQAQEFTLSVQNLNIISKTDVLLAVKQSQLKMFEEMQPEIKEDKLILHNPAPELIGDYRKWMFKKGREERE